MTWTQKTINNGRDCEHGHLARSCEICDYQKEIHDLRAALRVGKEGLDDHERGVPGEVEEISREAFRAKLKELGL